jgi:hypothetical protein
LILPSHRPTKSRLVASVALISVACTSAAFAQSSQGLTCHAPAKPMARLELVFGAGQGVSDRTFAAFLAKEITPRFPDGLSLFQGYGQWRNGAGRIVKETSRLLLIWYVPDAHTDEKIEAIRQAYKKRFHQQLVLRADETSCVSF